MLDLIALAFRAMDGLFFVLSFVFLDAEYHLELLTTLFAFVFVCWHNLMSSHWDKPLLLKTWPCLAALARLGREGRGFVLDLQSRSPPPPLPVCRGLVADSTSANQSQTMLFVCDRDD